MQTCSELIGLTAIKTPKTSHACASRRPRKQHLAMSGKHQVSRSLFQHCRQQSSMATMSGAICQKMKCIWSSTNRNKTCWTWCKSYDGKQDWHWWTIDAAMQEKSYITQKTNRWTQCWPECKSYIDKHIRHWLNLMTFNTVIQERSGIASRSWHQEFHEVFWLPSSASLFVIDFLLLCGNGLCNYQEGNVFIALGLYGLGFMAQVRQNFDDSSQQGRVMGLCSLGWWSRATTPKSSKPDIKRFLTSGVGYIGCENMASISSKLFSG